MDIILTLQQSSSESPKKKKRKKKGKKEKKKGRKKKNPAVFQWSNDEAASYQLLADIAYFSCIQLSNRITKFNNVRFRLETTREEMIARRKFLFQLPVFCI